MKNKFHKPIAVFLAFNILAEVLFPTMAYALTGGPSQPEVQSFEPVGTTEMVDLFSGDFVYNIPLLDVEGYPINISYHSGITTDQEASWAGLGWNINPGVINRNMRGLPDDFKGAEDEVTKDMFIKPNYTYGLSFSASFELFAFPLDKMKMLKKLTKVEGNLTASLGVFYNNYRGVGFEQSITPSISAGGKLKLNSAIAISSNTQSGLSISPSTGISLSTKMEKDYNEITGTLSFSVGSSFNSRTGVKSTTFSKGLSFKKTATIYDDCNADGKEVKKSNETKGSVGSGMNNSSAISYSSESYTPQISMSMTGLNISFNAKVGTEVFGVNPGFGLSGYYSSQRIMEGKTTISKPAYGYLYSSEANRDDNILHDVNREKDGSYSKNNPDLPITTYSYDIYAVSGQGIGGMFRPYRGDIGTVYDNRMTSDGHGGNLGGEVGALNLLKWGASCTYNWSGSVSKQWDANEGNDLASVMRFSKKSEITDAAYKQTYEPVYFKTVGEKTSVDQSFLAYQNLNDAVRPMFYVSDGRLTGRIRPDKLIKAQGEERTPTQEVAIHNQDLKRKKREPRNQPISYLTAEEAEGCLDKSIYSYALNNFTTFPNKTPILRTSSVRKNHHITEITTLNASGSRYVYGIPAYNNSQKEITFTVSGNSCGPTVPYNSNFITDKRGEQSDGYDAYYNATTTKGYAHSYLLTGVLGSDYVDVQNDGITEDDLGDYTKINYTRTSNSYNWRTPYKTNEATLSKGLKADAHDNKGSIVYGDKEVWYVHSIESKNYIAEFTVRERQDGKDVAGINGGIGTGSSYMLEKITLYNKKDRYEVNCVPIKTVHFVYDYELCGNVYNNTGNAVDKNGASTQLTGLPNVNINKGKLTLKQIYFTYGNSNKGALSRYNFSYANNQSYTDMSYDRWGNYKPNYGCGGDVGSAPNNADFPYVMQDQVTDNHAQAWTLNQIELPSGGVIDVNYESDDYAYVQNKKAMQMFKIKGFSEYGTTATNMLYENKRGYNYVHVQLTKQCSTVNEFIKRYIPDQNNASDPTRFLYFNVLARISPEINEEEYVRGYAEILAQDVKRVNNTEYAIKVKSVKSDDTESSSYAPNANPVAIAALQMFRLNLPQYAYPGSDMKKNPDAGEAAIRSLFGIFFEIAESMQGVNDRLLRNNFARNITPEKSWVRLKNPDGFKKGGGVRVKKIALSDNWNEMAVNGTGSTYGQEYDYTVIQSDGSKISSGVASYEPMIGNDENPFRQPILHTKENALVPDESFYSEEPLGESYFPSASVGYSKVIVKNIAVANVTKHATGKVVHEFYTTNDFPTIVSRTNTQSTVIKPNWLGGLFSLKKFNEVSAVQGYRIELNDMNGKPKAEWVYSENIDDNQKEGKRISGKEFIYHTDGPNTKHLNNNVKAVNAKGEIAETMVGVDADMILDTRLNYSATSSFGIDVNSEIMMTLFVPITLPIPFPSYSSEITRFRSAVITRVIQRYGILEKTIVYEDNATLTTENYAFDGATGEVLLTKTQNEYNDPMYNMSFPAHWTYDGMGMAYNNLGAEVDAIVDYGFIQMKPEFANIFMEGDEVLVKVGSSPDYTKGWIIKSNGNFKIIDQSNTVLPNKDATLCKIKIVRSGRRNQQSTTVQSISGKKLPLITSVTEASQILNSSASVFNDRWPSECSFWRFADPGYVYSNFDYQDYDDVVSATNFLLSNLQSPALDIPGAAKIDGSEVSTDFSITPITSSGYSNTIIYQNRHNYYHSPDIYQLYSSFSIPFDDNVPEESRRYINLKMNLPMGGDCNESPAYYSIRSFIGIPLPLERAAFFNQYKFTRIERISDYEYTGNAGFVEKGIALFNIYYRAKTGTDMSEKLTTGYFEITVDGCFENTQKCLLQGCFIEDKTKDKHPILSGQQGIWRKKKDYLYLTNRKTITTNVQNIRYDGFYSAYSPFWKFDVPSQKWISVETDWVWTSEAVKFDPKGMEIENKDKLERYSSALFNNQKQPEAVANNAQRREIGFVDFENMEDVTTGAICDEYHWKFNMGTSPEDPNSIKIDKTVSHTGYNSMKITAPQFGHDTRRKISNNYLTNVCKAYQAGVNSAACPEDQCTDCILPFNPFRNKKYVLSGWMKVAKEGNPINLGDENYNSVEVIYTSTNSVTSQPVVINPKGQIIDGWQRFEEVVTIPSNCKSVSVTLYGPGTSGSADIFWYDDVRIYPFNGNMKSYVYHPYNMKLMAELDENNYATFYEYDEQGALKRIKKETERGIMTVKESRSHTKK
jgi:hypothetical protein